MRKPNRLNHYDYSQNGAYFITLCVQNRMPILSRVGVGASNARPPEPELSAIGRIVDNAIRVIPFHYPYVTVDKYVIMPNHIHMILSIDFKSEPFGSGEQCSPLRSLRCEPTPKTVSEIVRQMKGYITKQCGKAFWQKSYYDHIIRDDYDYQMKWKYIDDNPARWCDDEFYSSSPSV